MRYGYFDEEKKEYVITRPDTPAPWVNYLGSPEYGAIISNNAVAAAVLSLCPVISVFCAPVSYVCGNISLIVLILSWVIQAIILGYGYLYLGKWSHWNSGI